MDAIIPWLLAAGAAAALGTWACAAPWNRWVRHDVEAARRLAAVAEGRARAQQEAERRAVAALATSEQRHRALARAGAVVIWYADREGRATFLEGWETLTGQPAAGILGSSSAWISAILPEHRARVEAAWRSAVADGTPFDAEYEIDTPRAGRRWLRSRGVPRHDPGGGVLEWVGVIEDVDDRHRAEEAQRLLARELDHRAKNLLAIVQAMMRLTPADDPEAFTASVLARLGALSRAHDLLVHRGWRAAPLVDVLRLGVGPYLGPDPLAPRIVMEGPPAIIAPPAIQPIAMLVHELAVNALKHGALSRVEGRATLRWSVDAEAVTLTWSEEDGPRVEAEPARRGTGSRVIDASVRQLAGSIGRSWESQGLSCRIRLPLARVADGAARPALTVAARASG